MDEIDETALARTGEAADKIWMDLTSGREKLAAALQLGWVIEKAYELGLSETVMTEKVFQIARERERVILDE